MGRRKREKFVDDGRTVANMNIEGMPWYNPALSDQPKEAAERDGLPALTGKETWAVMRGVLGAALLVALVFVGAFTLFILFCVFIWFG